MRQLVFLSLVTIALCGFERARGQANTNATSPNPGVASSLTPWIAPSALSALMAVISFVYAYRKDRNAARHKKTAEMAVARAEALETRLFYKAKAVSWRIEVEDLEGTVKMQCTFEDIQALPKGATLTGIPGALAFAPPDSTITQHPTLVHHSFRPTQLNREVCLNVLEPMKTTSYEYLFNIIGALPYGHSVSYTYEVSASRGIFMSKEEVDKNVLGSFKKEFWAHYVTTPVDVLEILISFPQNYSIERFYVGVCIGPKISSDNLMYGQEIQRIEDLNGFEATSNRARLKVKEPFVGLTYLIYWNPPAKRIVDALR